MTGRPIEEQLTRLNVREAEADAEIASPESQATAPNEWSEGTFAKRLLRPRTIASFAIAAAVVLFALSRFNLDLGGVLREMAHANPWYLLAATATYYGSFILRSARWRSLLMSADVKPAPGKEIPGLPTLSVIFVLSWFANCLVPAKLGDAYRGYLLKRRAGASFGATLGTIFAERLADLITLGVVLVACTLLVFGRHVPGSVSIWMYLALGFGLTMVAVLVIVYRFREMFRNMVPHRVRDHYIRLEEGTLGSFGRIPTLLVLTAVIWATEGLRLYFISLSVGAGINFSEALFVALLASLLTAIPITPAGLGFVEFGVVGTMTLLGVANQTGASVALLDRVVAYWSVLLVGAIVYMIARWAWREGGDARRN